MPMLKRTPDRPYQEQHQSVLDQILNLASPVRLKDSLSRLLDRCLSCAETRVRQIKTLERVRSGPIDWTKSKSFQLHQRGLGDTVESILSFVGLTKAKAQQILGSCGCDGRQSWLNKWFPYGSDAEKKLMDSD